MTRNKDCCGEYIAGSRCPACPDRKEWKKEEKRIYDLDYDEPRVGTPEYLRRKIGC